MSDYALHDELLSIIAEEYPNSVDPIEVLRGDHFSYQLYYEKYGASLQDLINSGLIEEDPGKPYHGDYRLTGIGREAASHGSYTKWIASNKAAAEAKAKREDEAHDSAIRNTIATETSAQTAQRAHRLSVASFVVAVAAIVLAGISLYIQWRQQK